MRQPIQVLVYPVRRRGAKPEYLLCHRRLRGHEFWQGVTGGVEGEEALSEAARRELAEETGLTPVALEQIDFSYTFPVADRFRHLYAPGVHEITEHVFLAWVDDQAEPVVSDEHDAWRWLPVAEALALLTWPGNIEALARCDRMARTHSRLDPP